MRLFTLLFLLYGFGLNANAQNSTLNGVVRSGLNAVEYASVRIIDTKIGSKSDSLGKYSITGLKPGKYVVSFTAIGYISYKAEIVLRENESLILNVDLKESGSAIQEFVVTGTMKEVSRLASPVPVEVYSPAFFRKNQRPPSLMLYRISMASGHN